MTKESAAPARHGAGAVAFVRDPNLFFTVADGELIVMDSKEEKFLTSNAVGSAIWKRLETPATLDDLCDEVLERFSGAEPPEVRVDVIEFLGALQDRGLVSETYAA